MLSIPGVGVATVAGFLAEVGDLSKYDHGQQIIRLAGLNLIENRFFTKTLKVSKLKY